VVGVAKVAAGFGSLSTSLHFRNRTRIKVEVSGTKARLYVNGATQPTLIVNDLKLGKSRGQVALWVGSDTEGYFSNLKVETNTTK